MPDFFLRSAETKEFEEIRSCKIKGQISYLDKTRGLWIEIDPSLIGQKYGLGDKDISDLILFPKFKNTGLFPISEWPFHVLVYRALDNDVYAKKKIENDQEIEMIVWASIFKNKESAENYQLVSSAADKGIRKWSKKMNKIFLTLVIIGSIGGVLISRVLQTVNVTSPQTVTLVLRASQPVAKGQAVLRLMPDIDKGEDSEEGETVGSNPKVDVKCGNKELYQIKLTEQHSETVCGIQVRLLKAYKDDDVPVADVEVTW